MKKQEIIQDQTKYTFLPYFDGYFQNNNFYTKDGLLLKKRSYNNRLCIQYKQKVYGLKKLRTFSKKEINS